MQAYLSVILKYRWWVISLIAAVTVGAGFQISKGVFASSLVKLFFDGNEKYAQYVTLMEDFGSSDVMLVAYDKPDLFSPEGFKQLEQITTCLDDHKEIRRATSLWNAQRMTGANEELYLDSYGSLITKTATLGPELKRHIMQDELLAGLFLSRDGNSTAITIEFVPDDNRPAESLPAFLEEIHACFINAGLSKDQIHSAGLMPESSEVTRVAQETLLRTVPFTTLILVGIVFLLFRRLWPVTITSGIAVIAVTWTVAFAIFIDRQVSIFIAAVPAVMMVICFSDVIHLCSAYLLELKAGHPKDAALRKSAGEVSIACLFTSMTTFVGFISLTFVPTLAFRQLGLVLGFGVAVALILAITLAPIFFHMLPEPEVPTVATRNVLQYWVDRANQYCLRVSTQFPKRITVGFLIFLALFTYGSSQIRIETNFLDRLDEDNPARISHEYIRQRYAGTNIVDLYVITKDQDGVIDPQILTKISEAQKKIEALAEVDQVMGITDLFEQMGDTMNTPPLPSTKQGAAQYLILFEMSGGDDLDRIINSERNKTRISLRLNTNAFVKTADVGNRAAAIMQEKLGKEGQAQVTGMTYLLGDWIDEIVKGQLRGLVFAFMVTTLMMLLCLRSLRAGTLSMIPNMLPLLAVGGYLGLAWDTVDSDLMFVALIAIGIGVDDTIHFLTRLRLELKRNDDLDVALKNTFHFTGRAIIQTTIILTAGFLPFLTTGYLSTQVMGSLLPMTLFVALVADLLFVPALAKLNIFKF